MARIILSRLFFKYPASHCDLSISGPIMRAIPSTGPQRHCRNLRSTFLSKKEHEERLPILGDLVKT
jgi:hypothetical protein